MAGQRSRSGVNLKTACCIAHSFIEGCRPRAGRESSRFDRPWVAVWAADAAQTAFTNAYVADEGNSRFSLLVSQATPVALNFRRIQCVFTQPGPKADFESQASTSVTAAAHQNPSFSMGLDIEGKTREHRISRMALNKPERSDGFGLVEIHRSKQRLGQR